MVRCYKRVSGPNRRRYNDFSPAAMAEALSFFKKNKISVRNLSVKFNIPRSTLARRIAGIPSKPIGGQRVFAEEEENLFATFIATIGDWGFPFTKTDLRMFIKKYLNDTGRQVAKFKDNTPGHDWVANFMKRQKKIISARTAQNIKSVRKEAELEHFEKYFHNLKESLAGIPPTNILNFDETNLCDEPGAEKCIFRTSSRRTERRMDSSRSNIGVMFAGTAVGQLLAPYVLYKCAKRPGMVKESWQRDFPPPNAYYNSSSSGWFDVQSFEDWFKRVAVPWARSMVGRKIVIGDNVATHFSKNVLTTCERLDIGFICLPAHTTHLTQPLDVAFFAPLKRAWRKILCEWKTVNVNCRQFKKENFPKYLKTLLTKCNSANLIAGFKSCGIFPYNSI